MVAGWLRPPLRSGRPDQQMRSIPGAPGAAALLQASQHDRSVVAHERVHAFARFQLVDAIGQAAHPPVQGIELLVAVVQASLQIQDADDAGEVDALIGQVVDQLQASMSASEYMRVLPRVR